MSSFSTSKSGSGSRGSVHKTGSRGSGSRSSCQFRFGSRPSSKLTLVPDWACLGREKSASSNSGLGQCQPGAARPSQARPGPAQPGWARLCQWKSWPGQARWSQKSRPGQERNNSVKFGFCLRQPSVSLKANTWVQISGDQLPPRSRRLCLRSSSKQLLHRDLGDIQTPNKSHWLLQVGS